MRGELFRTIHREKRGTVKTGKAVKGAGDVRDEGDRQAMGTKKFTYKRT